MDGIHQIRWTACFGFGGRHAPDSLVAFDRITQSKNGERKQIDASFGIGNTLIIVECKAVGMSIGFNRGDPTSIRYRNERIDSALADIDEKARWLANNPIGTNYDISSFSAIVPLVVTPFVEYIPSIHSRNWLKDEMPRVLSPREFKQALENNEFANIVNNIVTIKQKQG